MAFKTEAIVLHARLLKAADRIYDVLTPHDGKLSVVATGAAKSTSKMAGHLQPFARVRLMVGRGRRDHLAGVTTVESYRELRGSLQNFILASSLVELILRINVPGQAAAEEFVLLCTAFDLLRAASPQTKVRIGRIFLWKLLTLSGWKPNFEHCSSCHEDFASQEVRYQSPKGFICGRHGTEGIRLDRTLLPFLATVIASDDWQAILAAVPADLEKQWFMVSQQFYQDVIGFQLKSANLFAYAG